MYFYSVYLGTTQSYFAYHHNIDIFLQLDFQIQHFRGFLTWGSWDMYTARDKPQAFELVLPEILKVEAHA